MATLALAFAVIGSTLGHVRVVIAQADPTVVISSPEDGAVLSGAIDVRGTAVSSSFLSAQLAFSYADSESDTWFEITELGAPVDNSILARWDTLTVSDGPYRLRLRLNGLDGTIRDAVLTVQIRNYTVASLATVAATQTAQPVLKVETPAVIVASPTRASIALSTPTPLPANPAMLTQAQVLAGFLRGGFAVVALFLLAGTIVLRRRP